MTGKLSWLSDRGRVSKLNEDVVIEQSWPAPAKVNLFLHITGRRDDGYHLLQTVFQFLDFGDELSFQLLESSEIKRKEDIPGVPEAQDLIVRAAKLLQAEAGVNQGVVIRINKQLPMGGGLGGGSSDAATTLVALNHLWGAGLSEDELAKLGLQLGADVPVFVRGFAAWAEGVGEHLESVTLPEPWFLVVIPPVHVSTQEIFSSKDLTRDCSAIKIRNFLSGGTGNVCEPVVFQRYPEVKKVFDWLQEFGPARMSGTGASVFAPFESEVEARQTLNIVPANWRAFVAKGLNWSPLVNRLKKEASC